MKNNEHLVIHFLVFPFNSSGGNPCPIVFPSSTLKKSEMQSISSFYKLETGFILSPSDNRNKLSLKYFVPNYEMEMCIHATIGAIQALLLEKKLNTNQVKIETPLGVISADIHNNFIYVDQFSPVLSTVNPSQVEVCKALNIPESVIDREIGPIQSVSTSRPKLIVPVKNYKYLASMKPKFKVLWELCDQYETTGFYVFTGKTRTKSLNFEARQYPNKAGYPEDPATGVAAGALGAYLANYLTPIQNNDFPITHSFRIGQGFDMGKPSLIISEITMENHKIQRVRVGGTANLKKRERIFIENGEIRIQKS